MNTEKRIIADQRKIQALRDRIREVTYMTATEVREHLHMSRDTLDGTPSEVLPWAPAGGGKERTTRRYHPADVAAYAARARRLRNATDPEACLAEMRAEIEDRDRKLIADALKGYAA